MLDVDENEMLEVHQKVLDFAGELALKGVNPTMICSVLIAVALRSYRSVMTQEEVVMLLEHMIDDIDQVKPFDIPSLH
tara:strand:+ start:9224 stop:9457 length:234 start_codon:yes stop_codon:yes gene_type:complete